MRDVPELVACAACRARPKRSQLMALETLRKQAGRRSGGVLAGERDQQRRSDRSHQRAGAADHLHATVTRTVTARSPGRAAR